MLRVRARSGVRVMWFVCRGSMCARRGHREHPRGVGGDVEGVYKSEFLVFSVPLGSRLARITRQTLIYIPGSWS